MQDDPLNLPTPKSPGGPADALILWVMVALFGVVWVLVVFFNRNPGDAMVDPFSTGPIHAANATTQSLLLGAGLAILGVGVIGGARDYGRAKRRAAIEKRNAPAKPVNLVCPRCGQEAPRTFQFCPHCAAPLTDS